MAAWHSRMREKPDVPEEFNGAVLALIFPQENED